MTRRAVGSIGSRPAGDRGAAAQPLTAAPRSESPMGLVDRRGGRDVATPTLFSHLDVPGRMQSEGKMAHSPISVKHQRRFRSLWFALPASDRTLHVLRRPTVSKLCAPRSKIDLYVACQAPFLTREWKLVEHRFLTTNPT